MIGGREMIELFKYFYIKKIFTLLQFTLFVKS